MKWHFKLFIVLLLIATIIHFFAPSIEPIEETKQPPEVTHHDDKDGYDDDDYHDHDERVIHYEITEPKTIEEANAILRQRTALIGKIMAKDELDHNDLEKIHEHSYSLEAAIDKLRDEQAYQSEENIDNLDEAIQALHYASESHEETESREWFGQLKAELANF